MSIQNEVEQFICSLSHLLWIGASVSVNSSPSIYYYYYYFHSCMESYFEKGRHEHDYAVVALGNFLEQSLRNLNYHNIFIGTIF